MQHPCPQEHPYRLDDCPATLLFAWWNDTALDDTDSQPLHDAMHRKHHHSRATITAAATA